MKRIRHDTIDRPILALDRAGHYYAPEKLGKSRRITPEGFLICEGVPIARTGTQLYHSSELPLEADGSGLIRVERPPDEVFRDDTISSFEGKPVTIEHPNEFVSPETWGRYAVGTVQNVRRGEGLEDDLLIADLLITKADAIAYVNRELPELSSGYHSKYDQSQPGRAVQRNILGNHVALVERGRAGPRVAVKDSLNPEVTTMSKLRTSFVVPDGTELTIEGKRYFAFGPIVVTEQPSARVDLGTVKTGDRGRHPGLAPSPISGNVTQLTRDGNTKLRGRASADVANAGVKRVQEINESNAAFWASQDGPPDAA